ncbi:hypothetical protein ACFL2T_03605 [Elusimicrobiota bacterium]
MLGLLTRRQTKGVSLEAYSAGILRVRGEVVSSMKSYHAKLKLPVLVVLIRHPKQGLILFGTGLSPDRERRKQRIWDPLMPHSVRYKLKKGGDIVSQLNEANVATGDVKWVILPFLGPESAGMIDSFPNATVVVTRREWEWRKSLLSEGESPGPLDPGSLEGRIRLRLEDLANKPAFGPFENGMDLFKDGAVFLVGLPGRTPGNMGLWVNLDGGPVLLTGGAAYVVDNFLDLALPVKGRFTDLDEYWRSLHIIQAARRDIPQLVVVPGNDLSSLRTASGRSDIGIVGGKKGERRGEKKTLDKWRHF